MGINIFEVMAGGAREGGHATRGSKVSGIAEGPIKDDRGRKEVKRAGTKREKVINSFPLFATQTHIQIVRIVGEKDIWCLKNK